MLNGDGLRVVLWVAGCSHHCKGCQNPITWDPEGGVLFDEAAKQEIFEQLDKSYIEGITSAAEIRFMRAMWMRSLPLQEKSKRNIRKRISGCIPDICGKIFWICRSFLIWM